MKIGLVRHFEVDLYEEGEVDFQTYNKYMYDYDFAEVIESEVDLRDIEWNRAFSSTLLRAKVTAETIYSGEIIESDLIVEVDIRLKEKMDGKKSLVDWFNLSIDSWLNNHGLTLETMDYSKDRINSFLDKKLPTLKDDDNVLIVCHGLIMRVIESELKKRGFIGEVVGTPKNGQLILLSK